MRHGASGVDIDGGGRPTLECLQPSLDLGRSNNASVNSRVVQARKALAIGRRQAVALTDGGGKIAPARATETLGDVPPPVRRPVVQSPARARPPPPPSALPARQGNTAIGGTNFRKMLDARKAEAAVSDARMSAALHAAVKTGDPGAVQRLIDSGASVNTADDAGRTPLLRRVRGTRKPHAAVRLECDSLSSAKSRVVLASTLLIFQSWNQSQSSSFPKCLSLRRCRSCWSAPCSKKRSRLLCQAQAPQQRELHPWLVRA